MKKILSIIAFALLLTGCEYDSTDDLVQAGPVGAVVDYTTYVKPIIENNCYACHGETPIAGAPMSLTSYALVKEAVQDRGLINRITLPEGHESLMPQGGPRLPDATIDLIVQWKNGEYAE